MFSPSASHKAAWVTAVLTCIFLLSACQSAPKHKTRLLLIDDYSQEHLEVNIAEFTTAQGTLGVQASIRNDSDEKVHFQYRFQWATEGGQYVDSPAAIWVPISLDPQDTYEAQNTQVTPQTTRPKLSIKKL